MRPNLASPGLLEQPVSSGCGVRLLARVRQWVTRVDLPTPSIISRLRCRHRLHRLCNLVGRPWQSSARVWQLRASWRLLWPTAHAWKCCEPPRDECGPPLAPGSCEAPGCAPPVAPGSCEPPSCVLLPPECTWVAHLQDATLRARPTTANPARSRSRRPTRQTLTPMLRTGPLVLR
jgi:hypothetical protein